MHILQQLLFEICSGVADLKFHMELMDQIISSLMDMHARLVYQLSESVLLAQDAILLHVPIRQVNSSLGGQVLFSSH